MQPGSAQTTAHLDAMNEIVCAADFQRVAAERLPPSLYAFIAGGSGNGTTTTANVAVLEQIRINQRVLRDCRQGSTQLSLLGNRLRHPILMAPVGWQRLLHSDGELGTAAAADALESIMVLSGMANVSLEDAIQEARGRGWFQIYWHADRERNRQLVERAENAGYQALVLTVDAPVRAPDASAHRAGFRFPSDMPLPNMYPAKPGQVTLDPEMSVVFQGAMSEAPDWEDIAWLKETTSLPLIVKGITHPGDALKFKAAGVDGLIVSNHGGRSLDGLAAMAELLPDIRSAVGPEYPLLADGGIDSGADVFRTIALGANAVLVGRLQAFSLALAGGQGVARMIRLLRDELEVTMALAGCPTIQSITRDAIRCHPS